VLDCPPLPVSLYHPDGLLGYCARFDSLLTRLLEMHICEKHDAPTANHFPQRLPGKRAA